MFIKVTWCLAFTNSLNNHSGQPLSPCIDTEKEVGKYACYVLTVRLSYHEIKTVNDANIHVMSVVRVG